MKNKYILLIYIFIYFACNIINSSANASSYKLISTSPIGKEETTNIITSIDFRKENSEKIFSSISCFAINDESIALGFNDGDRKYINIYDDYCNYEYSYSFDNYGSFGIDFQNDTLLVYLLRENIVISINKDITTIEVKSVEENDEYQEYLDKFVCSKVKVCNGNKYYLSTGDLLFSPSYTQLVKVDENNNKEILFDFTKDNYINLFVIGTVVLLFVCIVLLLIYSNIKRKK